MVANPFVEAVSRLRPGADFSNADNTLAGIRWDTKSVTPPTQAEVDAMMLAVKNPLPLTPAEIAAKLGVDLRDLKAALAATNGS